MRRLIVVAPRLVRTGGMDRPNLALVERALERGLEVTAVTHGVEPGTLDSPRLELWRVPKPLSSILLGEVILERAGALARRRYPEAIVLANGGNLFGADLNWVHYVHAAEPALGGSGPQGLYRRYRHERYVRRERLAFASAKVLIADSKRCRDDLLAHYPLDRTRVRSLYYGTDPSLAGRRLSRSQCERNAGLEPGVQRAMFVGGIGDRRKGLDTLLKAWALLKRRGDWPVELLVVGDGPARARFEREASALQLSGSVHFLGFRTDVPTLLGAVDCIAAPTRYEPYGLAVHEALCVRVPAIVSEKAGIAERYPPSLRPLLLSDPENVDELASKLTEWRNNAGHYARAASEFAPQLSSRSWSEMADEILDLAETMYPVLSRRGVSGG